MPQNENIFQVVNERYNIVEVARDLGIRIKKVASGVERAISNALIGKIR